MIDQPQPKFLVIGTNWLGDSVMALPCIQAFRASHPGCSITACVREGLAPLWECAAAVDDVFVYDKSLSGMLVASKELAEKKFWQVIVLPNSIRTALLARLTGIPVRKGLPATFRKLLLTDIVSGHQYGESIHQRFEYLKLFGLTASAKLPFPELKLPSIAIQEAEGLLEGHEGPFWMLVPGAARGPSKQWPGKAYSEVGTMLLKELGGQVVILGTGGEVALCDEVKAGIGDDRALSLAGKTSLPGWMALLARAHGVIANDSGGMHVAAALGVPTVGIFGLTNAAETGPFGPRCSVVTSGVDGRRDIPRDSDDARKSLASIKPLVVYEALQSALIAEPGFE